MCQRAVTWRATTIDLEAAHAYPDPVRDCRISVTFEHEGGARVVREAYWDGGATYRVSFAPTADGIWRWEVEAPADSGLRGREGRLFSAAYEGELGVFRHGFLRVGAGGRHFEHADGTPFFWLGDTHWEFAWGERWDESSHPGMASQFRGMVDRRVAQGFTVYQTNLRADLAGEGRFWRELDGARGPVPNVEFFADELDRRMAYVADAGLVNALGIAWGFNLGRGLTTVDNMCELARYVVARYGALPVVWTLAGEVAGYDDAARDELIAGWREVALEIERRDGYGQLATAHYTNERPFADYYFDEPWFDFALNQAGHGDYVVAEGDYRAWLARHEGKPLVEGEALYELCSSLEEMGPRKVDAAMVRRVAYMAIQCGCAGYTYGAQGIWDNAWEKSLPAEGPARMVAQVFNRYGVTWDEAIDAPGAEQMGHMRRFFEDCGWWRMRPYGAGGSALLGRHLPMVTVSPEGRGVVAYYASTVRKRLAVEGVACGPWSACWFDPRVGRYGEPFSLEAPDGTLELPDKIDMEDWVLVARARLKG